MLDDKGGEERERAWVQGCEMASSGSSGVHSSVVVILGEHDIPGALLGRKPEELKNSKLKFGLKCRGDTAKGLKTESAAREESARVHQIWER